MSFSQFLRGETQTKSTKKSKTPKTNFGSFLKQSTPPKQQSETRTATFPSRLGGGSYVIGPDITKVYKQPRSSAGLSDDDPSTQFDHIFPVSLGGTSHRDNLRVTKNNPAKLEGQVWEDYEKGKLALGQARLSVITHKQNQENVMGINEKSQSTTRNFFKSLPGALKKAVYDIPKEGAQSLIGNTKKAVQLDTKALKEGTTEAVSRAMFVPPLSGQDPEKTKLTSEDRKKAFKAGPVGSLGYETALRTQHIVKNPSDYADIAGIKNVAKPATKGVFNALKQWLKPAKQLDTETQTIFSKWVRGNLVGKELANEELSKINIPNKKGLETILKHEQGITSQPLKQSFDKLRSEAQKRGIDVGYRENYLPQVYKNKPQEVAEAVARFMKDQGVDDQIVSDYLAGRDIPEAIVTRLKLTPTFSKSRVFPDYKTAMEYGLTPRYSNPAQLLAHYREELEKTVANRQLLSELISAGKVAPPEAAERNWKALELPFSPKGYFAEPKLASMLNGIFRDENNLNFGQKLFKGLAGASKKAQEITLSAGIPKTNVNFFAIGQLVKQATAGDFKAIPAFVRANSLRATTKFFSENQTYLKKMATQGIDLGNRIGSYRDVYKNLAEKSIGQKVKSNFGVVAKSKTIGSWMKKNIGEQFDKAFNEKTFASFMPQLYTQTFKDAHKRALKKGLSEIDVDKFAADVTKNMFGLFENVGRSKTTEDVLSATFFAPKFREGIINTLLNTGKSVTTQIRNPAFYKNRRLVAGMILTYAGYNALNKKLNGNYMWDNEPGREFALKIPVGKDIVYVEFMPSFLAFARNLASGGIALGKGDFKSAGQKFGSVFSMPIKITSEVVSNKDYFGNPIYKETDSTQDKLKKVAAYVGLSVNHPFIKETVKQLTSDKPLYQSIITGMELPLKFSTMDKVAKQQFYDAMEKAKTQRTKEREAFKSTFERIQAIQNLDEQQREIDALSEHDYELYKSLLTSSKRKASIDGQARIKPTFDLVQRLKAERNEDEANRILNSMSDEDYHYYELLENKLNP